MRAVYDLLETFIPGLRKKCCYPALGTARRKNARMKSTNCSLSSWQS